MLYTTYSVVCKKGTVRGTNLTMRLLGNEHQNVISSIPFCTSSINIQITLSLESKRIARFRSGILRCAKKTDRDCRRCQRYYFGVRHVEVDIEDRKFRDIENKATWFYIESCMCNDRGNLVIYCCKRTSSLIINHLQGWVRR